MSRIYLDNAATSWPKPDGVYAAIDHAQRVLGAPAGRGAYYEANDASRVVEHARNAAANFINAFSGNGLSKREGVSGSVRLCPAAPQFRMQEHTWR